MRGDDLPGAYSGGKDHAVGRNRLGYALCQQKCETDAAGNIVVETMLQSPHGHFCHYLKYLAHTGAAESWTEFFNTGKKAVTLEMLSSFSISGITPWRQAPRRDSLEYTGSEATGAWREGS